MRLPRFLAAAILSVTPALAEEAPDPLRFGTNEVFLALSPFVQMDVGRLSASPDRLADDIDKTDAALRRARIYADFGYHDLGGRLTIDFAPSDGPEIVYAYVDYALSEALTIRAGQQDLPFSLQDLTGSRSATFNEDGQNANLLPGDLTGASLAYGGERFSLSGGVFGADINEQPFDDGWTVSGRATFAPYLEGDDAVHLGLGLMGRFDAEGPRSFSGDAGASLFDVATIETGDFEEAEQMVAGNLEFAATLGRVTFQSEYTLADVEDRRRGTAQLNGGYAALLVFLTEDHRGYEASSGTFEQVKPRRPAGEGIGAIEAGLRVDHLDLSDAGPDAGEQWSGTGIVNWYPADMFRLSLSHAVTEVVDGPEDGATFQTTLGRFAFIY
ncbi:hypothetical protein ASG43_13985 [Aureimonas sp. Leaf454]|uniref:OprO/OprP family phosphate-selective porin n=1 Tax=Aureimonas sp. Leaf454 TaxID=1736381 RepID=UPI0006F58C3D|nr:porin [Aureimonas sp. Leaf454]KQT44451.1 hypothetical protein ASG43_13985 [Aureimonas sp. Leaf454]